MSGFDEAFSALLSNEGGYANNSVDPGGETCFGITERVARENGYTGDIRALPLEQAKTIARRVYWDRYLCDQLPGLIAFQLFDIAYNGGYAVKWLQLALGVNADGNMGPETIAAARSAEPRSIVLRLNAYRLSWYTSLSTWPTFGRGWANRVAANLLEGAR
jgi:lysozyme family protein